MNIRLAVVAAGGLALLSAGCQEEIRRYEVLRPEPVAEAPSPEKTPVRLLVAMVPHADRTWFFKLVGPAETVGKQQQAFDAFVQSVKFTTDSARPLEWKTPDGWQADSDTGKPGAMIQRYATFHMGPAEQQAELTVTALGREVGSLLANVNRWRGQIGLKPVEQAELSQVSKPLKVGDDTGTLIDMSGNGTLASGGRKPPVGSAPFANHPPIRSAPGAAPVKYTTPAGWKELPAGGMRVAAFQVTEGPSKAEVTIIPLAGSSGSPLDNVNRWRGQVGLPPVTAEALASEMKPVTISGGPGYYVDIAGAGSPSQRILAVIVRREGQTWFVKMMGSSDLVLKQKAAFEAFVRSLEFAGPTGANRG